MSDHSSHYRDERGRQPQQPFDLLAVGEILADVISAESIGVPRNGEAFNAFIGGQVTNIALNLAQLGARTAVIGAVGNDVLGDFCRAELKQRGVSVEYIHTVEQPTTIVMVGRSSQTPWFIPYREADHQVTPASIPETIIEQTRVIHTSAFALGYEPMRSTVLHILEQATGYGISITLDPNYYPAVWDGSDPQTILPAALRNVTLTKPSLDDCIRLFGAGLNAEEYIARFHNWGARSVVLTRGGLPPLVSDGTTITELPLPSVRVVDVTGAGDAFWSGTLLALMRDQPLLAAAQAGVALAAQKVQRIGPLQAIDVKELGLM